MIRLLILFALLIGSLNARASECARIYYDERPKDDYWLGKVYALELENLLGHFPEFQVAVAPIESYQAGDLDLCRASFYLGSYFENKIPQAFLADYARTGKNVAWLGYSIWKLGPERLAQALGARYRAILSLDPKHPDSAGHASFFQDILYLGETFRKFGETSHGDFIGDPDLVALDLLPVSSSASAPQVLASARNPVTGERIPYAIRNANRFFIADIPFSFIHEADRYLVLADLLFDILDAKPRYPDWHPAALRIEDVHACLDQANLRKLGAYLNNRGIPFEVALIPVFSDPLKQDPFCPGQVNSPISKHPEFVATLKELVADGGSIIWHGVTHQYGAKTNPYTGISGDDYEFWDTGKNAPVSEDSVGWILNRMNLGWQSLEDQALKPMIWETPHYRGSVLDYLVFGRVMPWTSGRIEIFPFTFSGEPAEDAELWYPKSGVNGTALRQAALKDLSAQALQNPQGGQFFPYEIYGDMYGERVWPEDLGFIPDPNEKHRMKEPLQSGNASVDAIIANLRRNSKLRDAWASFFYHPYLFQDYGPKDLERVISAIQGSGYRFINLGEMSARESPLRPPPVITR